MFVSLLAKRSVATTQGSIPTRDITINEGNEAREWNKRTFKCFLITAQIPEKKKLFYLVVGSVCRGIRIKIIRRRGKRFPK